MSVAAQPSGTVTLVFTDIEGSTRLLEELGTEGYREALAAHREVIRSAFVLRGGYEVDYEGDSFFYAFASAQAALGAVSEAMAGLEEGPIRVRVGIHTGEPGLDPPKYVGMDVHRAARLMASAHGGQVVVSATTAALVGVDGLVDLGEHRFRDLVEPERVFQLGDGAFPQIRSLYRSNLPVPATPFLGRERELGGVVSLLERSDVRMLTLTGPGGTGKTRLALQAAAEASDRFPDGVWWVPLAPLRDPQLLTSSIADALGIVDAPGRALDERVLAALAGKHALVLLDNIEHLLPKAATIVSAMRAADGPTWLVTSRERMQLQGEHLYAVPSLAQDEASELFLARAAAFGVQLQLSDAIRELCGRLDNLPLALELAAARTLVFTPEQLLARLSHRLDLLKGGRDVDPRQQSLRATIDWSYQLLDVEEQSVYRALSVFASGCTFDAAEHVAGADLEMMQSLLDKSLLWRRDTTAGPRYWMLDVIREFARDRLSEKAAVYEVGRSHAQYFLDRAEGHAALLGGAEQANVLARFAADHDEYRAALAFLESSGDVVGLLRLSVALRRFWEMRGHLREGLEWLEVSITRGGDAPQQVRAGALQGAGALACHLGDFDRAIHFSEASAAVWEQLGDIDGRMRALNTLGIATMGQEDYDRARHFLEAKAALARESGAVEALASSYVNLGNVAKACGDLETALRRYEEALPLARELADPYGLATTLLAIGSLFVRDGRTRDARELLKEAIHLMLELEHMEGVSETLVELAALAEIRQSHEVAAVLLGAADALLKSIGAQLENAEVKERTLRAARRALDGDALQIAQGLGAKMQPNEAASYALASID